MSLIGFRQLQNTPFAASTTQSGMRVANIDAMGPYYIVITSRTPPYIGDLTSLITTQGNAMVSIVIPDHGRKDSVTNQCTMEPTEFMTNSVKFLPRTTKFFMGIYSALTFMPMEFIDPINVVFKATHS